MIYKILIGLLIILLGISGFANFYLYTQQTTKDTQYSQLLATKEKEKEKAIYQQRLQKNEIADIFDKQAGLNDDLISSQKDVNLKSKDYLSLVATGIRFVDGKPQLLPGAIEQNFLDGKNKLLQSIVDLDKISQENNQTTKQNSSRVKQIYIDSGEDRNNTINDREGIR